VFSRQADASGAGGGAVTTVGEATGDDPMLRKSNPGGWSQRRYQQRAENLWEENAKAVADQVAGLVDEIGARTARPGSAPRPAWWPKRRRR
jgi:hypothetical protein